MLIYQPPKSSLWGHSLGKKHFSVIGERIESFTTDTIEDPQCKGGYISILPTGFGKPLPQDVFEKFENYIGSKLVRGYSKLDEPQCNLALELALVMSSATKLKSQIRIAKKIEFQKWLLDGECITTPDTSNITWILGTTCSVSTSLYFSSDAEFKGFSELLVKHSLCKLNPKYLKTQKP
ncbi:hypothetical protein [Alteromonas sp. AMM-1]|uniref:hypothetical protein n=1 Tax=Alteromonas sp. AMM-1 TaxID=3394233 RepID=UPI0039A5CF02